MTSSARKLGGGWIGWSGQRSQIIHLLPQTLPGSLRPKRAICGRQFMFATWLPEMGEGGQGIEPEDICALCRQQVEAGPGAFREQPPEQLSMDA